MLGRIERDYSFKKGSLALSLNGAARDGQKNLIFYGNYCNSSAPFGW
jgi:hypothetical protein